MFNIQKWILNLIEETNRAAKVNRVLRIHFRKKGIKIPPPKILTEVFLFTVWFKSFYVENAGLDFFSVTMRTLVGDNACVAANGISVDGMID